MSRYGNQPDWDKIAEKFDLWLPQLAPVGEALLAALQARSGDHVLDLASGTGEPALTLARRAAVTITGVDAAAGMVNVAQAKCATDGMTNIAFHCHPAERLPFPDDSFDGALCRFGVMLFEDPLQGLKEMHRTLKPGGRFALAVWAGPETMTTLRWAYEVLKERLPEDRHPPLHKVTSLGPPGVLEGLLQQAGFRDYAVDTHTFHYRFPNFESYWDLVEASDILKEQYDALPPQERIAVRDEIGCLAAGCLGDGGLLVPHQYLLACGHKG